MSKATSSESPVHVAPAPAPLPAPAPSHGDEVVDLPGPPTVGAGTVIGVLVVGGMLLAGLFVLGWMPRAAKARELIAAATASHSGLPRVEVVKPRRAAGAATILLPGSIEPLRETWLYARASGFVRKWYADIGDSVTEGQPILELDTPELDAELLQAKATEAQAETAVELAKANRDLAKVTASRYDRLGPSGVASQQDVEDRRTQLAVAEANVRASQAAVESQKAAVNRLVDLKSFSRMVAPFSGRVTVRNVEIGQLVNAGAAGGQGLFRLQHIDTVRVFVHVPQEQAPEVQLGQPVTVTIRGTSDSFTGKVTHTAGAIDPVTRTLNTEVQIPNADHRLLAGMFVQATLDVGKGGGSSLRVPSAALAADSHGTRLAVVDPDNKLRWVPVQVGRDMGTEIEVTSGLKGDEQVVIVLPEGTPDGSTVEIRKPEAKAKS